MLNVEFQSRGTLLRGALHLPESGSNVPGILILPGFADTAVGPHNLHVCLARALAQVGYAVLRFDYAGLGESEGDFRDFTAQAGLEQSLCALELLRRHERVDKTQLGLVGFSLGGALACELAAQTPEIRALALLAPVAYPGRVFENFFTPAHREQAARQGWIDWLGWAVGGAYLPSLASLDPLTAFERSRAMTLVVHGTQDAEVSGENARAYAQRGATLHWLTGGDHQFSSVAWQNEALDCVRDWFQSHLSFQAE